MPMRENLENASWTWSHENGTWSHENAHAREAGECQLDLEPREPRECQPHALEPGDCQLDLEPREPGECQLICH
jgi:hypothetical protein